MVYIDFTKCQFRPAVPDDKISMSVGYDYREYTEGDEEVIEVQDFLSKYIFPDDEVKQYAIEYCASILKEAITMKPW